MTDTITLTLTATFSGDVPTAAEKRALFLRVVHNVAEALTAHEIGLTIADGVQAVAQDKTAPAKTRGAKLTAERVREIAESPEGWVKAAGIAGYTPAGIRGAAERFGIDLPGVKRRAA